MKITRRDHLKGLVALGAAAFLPPADPVVPPHGIGRRIRHVSYSNQGGRPDGVQVMVNRKHVYVGHMFSDGVTILEASDPRVLRPVGFFTAGTNTRTHHLQVADDLLLLANGANIVAMQSYDNLRGYFENALADTLPSGRSFGRDSPFTTSRDRPRCGRSRFSRCPASASTGCGGAAAGTP